MFKLKQLTLGGFQTIEKPCVIEFAPVTLLFGPNSAGKSAVSDALNLLQKLFFIKSNVREKVIPLNISGELTYVDASGEEWTDRHEIFKSWRRTEQWKIGDVESLQKCLYQEMTLGAKFEIKTRGWAGREDIASVFDTSKLEDLKSAFIDILSIFRVEDANHNDYKILERSTHISFGGLAFVEFESWGKCRINLEHPVLKYYGALEKQDFLLKVNWGNNQHLDMEDHYTFRCIDGWLNIHSLYRNVSNDSLKLLYDRRGEPLALDIPSDVSKIVIACNIIIGLILKQATFDPIPVDASRKIPSKNDLCHLVSRNSNYSTGEDTLSMKFGLTSSGDEQYYSLARSCANNIPDYDERKIYSKMFENVNRYLSDYMFVDRGYQIDFDYSILLDSAEYREIEEGMNFSYLSAYDILIRIYLVDSSGLHLNFSDVGSGLGYSLPVLLSAASDRDSFVQQPELHLHPALQGSLADVYIDGINEGRTTIIETHSEHFILRLLRRIRQTRNGQAPSDELRVTSNDVRVHYFDTLPDGSTDVKLIRISNAGEFLDKWPHGFFEERDRELFDE